MSTAIVLALFIAFHLVACGTVAAMAKGLDPWRETPTRRAERLTVTALGESAWCVLRRSDRPASKTQRRA